LQGEVVGLRRPLRLYGRAEHRRQVVPQLDLERLAGLVWREHDGVHETAQRLGRLDTTFGLLECRGEFRDLRAVDPAISGCRSGGGSSVLASLASSCSRLAAFAFSSSLTTKGATPSITISITFAADLDAFDLTLGG